jgi:hypothetical protein
MPVCTSACRITEEKGANAHWMSWRKLLSPPSLSSSSAPPPSSPSPASPSTSRVETKLSLTRRRAVSAFVPASGPSAIDEDAPLEHVVRARSRRRPGGGARGAYGFRPEKRIGRVGRGGSSRVVVADAIGGLRAPRRRTVYPGRRVAAAHRAEESGCAGTSLPASRRPVSAGELARGSRRLDEPGAGHCVDVLRKKATAGEHDVLQAVVLVRRR